MRLTFGARKLVLIAGGAVLLLSGSRAVAAQSLAVSGSPPALRITTAIAGLDPTAVNNGSTTYTITTPNPQRTYRISAQLDAALPTGVTLTATFAAPTGGGVSVGAVALSTTPQDVVTGIPHKVSSTQAITYQLSATAAAGVIAATSRTVTLTLLSP